MLDRAKHVIALSTWSLEKRGRWWYIVKPQFFRDPGIEKGPYSSILSACLTIARELAREAVNRQAGGKGDATRSDTLAKRSR